MYRGWYKGQRTFGSAACPGSSASPNGTHSSSATGPSEISEMEKANLRWEAKQFRDGRRLAPLGLSVRDRVATLRRSPYGDRPVSHRQLASVPHLGRLGDLALGARTLLEPARRRRQAPQGAAGRLGPPAAARLQSRTTSTDDTSAWTLPSSDPTGSPTADGQALLRNNRPLLAYIGGKASRFTSKDHNFRPGETVEKQIIVLNNSRETVTADCTWSARPIPAASRKSVTVATGQQDRVPVKFALPDALTPGKYELSATVKFSTGETQDDSFCHRRLAPARRACAGTRSEPARIALFDPKGETESAARRDRRLATSAVDAGADLSAYRRAHRGQVCTDGRRRRRRGIERVRDGLKVIVFEQTSPVLEKRLGFRVAEYGLRQVFPRLPDHPASGRDRCGASARTGAARPRSCRRG